MFQDCFRFAKNFEKVYEVYEFLAITSNKNKLIEYLLQHRVIHDLL